MKTERNEGGNFRMKIKELGDSVEVYDSIPQIVLAQSFTVIAPEHPLVETLILGTDHEAAVREFLARHKKSKGDVSLSRRSRRPQGGGKVPLLQQPVGTGGLGHVVLRKLPIYSFPPHRNRRLNSRWMAGVICDFSQPDEDADPQEH
jgi:hypothetical protein